MICAGAEMSSRGDFSAATLDSIESCQLTVRETRDYNVSMTAKLISIGNSRGIRLPKKIIEQYGLSNDLELVLRDEELAIRPKHAARRGWDAAFKQMRRRGHDKPLLPDDTGTSTFDRREWTW
jgi:antitoxin MazE